jgi:calcium channel MID1
LVGNNCKLIYNLQFCSDVAYAVPANSSSNVSDLVSFYDSNAQSLYQFFNNSIQQIPCNTTNSAQWSLVSTCDDCADNYLTWLCAVTIPRCEDLSTPSNGSIAVVPRSMANATDAELQIAGINASYAQRSWVNSSRNQLIDQVINPGPYKELLPCTNTCFDLVRTCPAVLGFSCPRQALLMNRSYGTFDRRLASMGTWTCNFLGQDPDMPLANGAASGIGAWFQLLILIGLLHLALW